MKRTFSKSDWSGEKATIDFKRDGSFRLDGDDFVIVKSLHSEALYERAEVYEAGDKGRQFPVTSAIRRSSELEWVAGGDDDAGTERQHAIVEVALAQVLFNIT
jgi:hypothetical protein